MTWPKRSTVRCTELRRRSVLAPLLALAACTLPAPQPPGPPARREPVAPPPGGPPVETPGLPPSTASKPAPPPAVLALPLPPPPAARNWADFRVQAARRLLQAHPQASYSGPSPDPLLAIPVLEVELNADGSVRRVQVLRHPRSARDTTQLAIDAVHRAAPYGSMGRLPRPWKWVVTFLFDDERRFKPRELD